MIDLSHLLGPADAPDVAFCTFRVFPKAGSERWMLEADQRRPWHLKTWPRANLRARMIFRMAWVLGALGLHLPSRIETYPVAPGSAYAQLQAEFERLGIFLGTPGPNRKIVVYAARPERSVFVKIPLGAASAALVARETEALKELARDPDLSPLIPAAERIAGHLAVQDIETGGTRHEALDLREVLRVHDILERRSATTHKLSDLREDWLSQHDGTLESHDPQTTATIDFARTTAISFLDALPHDLDVPCYLAHGDFTRWNVLRATDGAARIIDWELYGLKPRWFDLVHYLVSHDLLVARRSPAKVVAHLERAASDIGATVSKKDWWRQVGLYFVYQSLYYCGLYERQVDLHVQAIWQLSAWSDILGLLPVDTDPDADRIRGTR